MRSHFPTRELDPLAYRLSICGVVRNELTLSYRRARLDVPSVVGDLLEAEGPVVPAA